MIVDPLNWEIFWFLPFLCFILWLYFFIRNFYVQNVFNLRINFIGLGKVLGIKNFDHETFDSFGTEDKIGPYFQIESIEIILGRSRNFEQGKLHGLKHTKSWINVVVKGIKLLVEIEEHNQISADFSTTEGFSSTSAAIILKHFGLISSKGQLSIIKAFYYPLGVVFRALSSFILGRLIYLQLEDFQVYINMPIQNLKFEWYCRTLCSGSEIVSKISSPENTNYFGQIALDNFLWSIFTRTFQYSLKLFLLANNFQLKGFPINHDSGSKNNVLLEVEETECFLSFEVKRFSSRFSSPNLSISLKRSKVFSDCLVDIIDYVSRTQKEKEINLTRKKDPTNETNVRDLERLVYVTLEKFLIFYPWAIRLSLTEFNLIHRIISQENKRKLFSLLSIVRNESSKVSSNEFVFHDDPSIDLTSSNIFLNIDSRNHGKKIDGSFLVECGIENFKLNITAPGFQNTIYRNRNEELLVLNKTCFKLQLPYGILFLMIPSMKRNYFENRLIEGEFILDNFHVVLDLKMVLAFAELLFVSKEGEASGIIPKSEDKTRWAKNTNYPLVLPKIGDFFNEFGIEIEILVQNVLFKVAADDPTENCSSFVIAEAKLEEFRTSISWNVSSSEKSNKLGYFNLLITISEIKASIKSGTYENFNRLIIQGTNVLFLPDARFKVTSTIPQFTDDSFKLDFSSSFKSSDLRINLNPETGLTRKFSVAFSSMIASLKNYSVENFIASNDYRKSKLTANFIAEESIFRYLSFKSTLTISIKNYVITMGVLDHDDTLVLVSLEEVKITNFAKLQNTLFESKTSGFVEGLHFSIAGKQNSKRSYRTLLNLHRVDLEQGMRDQIFFYNIGMDRISGNYSILVHYVIFKSFKYALNVIEPFRSVIDFTTTGNDRIESNLVNGDINVNVSFVNVSVDLPSEVSIFANLDGLKLKFDLGQSDIEFHLPKAEILNSQRVRIFSLDVISLSMNYKVLVENLKSLLLEFKMKSALWFIPQNYSCSSLFESITHFVSALKQLHQFGTVGAPSLDARSRVYESFNANKMPFNLNLSIEEFDMVIEDEDFDAKLNRIFSVGLRDQSDRLERYQLFEKKVQELKSKKTTMLDLHMASEDLTQEALDMLNEREFFLWKNALSSNSSTRIEKLTQISFPPLVHISGRSIHVCLKPPILLAPTVEETIHILDLETPVDLLYVTLVAVQVELQLKAFRFQLRDFPSPFIAVPNSTSGGESISTISGLVIFSEAITDLEKQTRYVKIPIMENNDRSPPLETITLARNIIPFKIYTDLTIRLTEESQGQGFSLSQFTFGPAIEPHLADMNKAFSKISPEGVDPSEKIAFWDRFRLHFHGNLLLIIPEYSAFRVRLAGSRNPHEMNSVRGSGLDINFKGGVNAKMQSNSNENEVKKISSKEEIFAHPESPAHVQCRQRAPITIEIGEVSCDIPYKSNGIHQDDIEVALIKKGVSITCVPDIETYQQGSHVNVVTVDPKFFEKDSFSSMRTKSITLNFTIKTLNSTNDPASGLVSVILSQNIIHHFEKFSKLNTSPISLMQIKSGNIFYPPPSKAPTNQKLSRYIKGINVQSKLDGILIGYFHKYDSSEVGLRAFINNIKATLSLQQENFIEGRRGADWEIVASDFDISGLRIKTFRKGDFDNEEDEDVMVAANENEPPSRLKSSKEVDEAPDKVWYFDHEIKHQKRSSEDQSSEETQSDITMNDLLWAPKVIHFRHGTQSFLESIDDFLETGESALPERDINMMQYNLLHERYQELGNDIEKYKSLLKYWKDRICLYQDDLLIKHSENLMDRLEKMFHKRSSVQIQMKQRLSKSQRRSSILMKPYDRHLDNFQTSEFKDHLGVHGPNTESYKTRRSRNSSVAEFNFDSKHNKKKEFLHRFLVHNLSVIWNKNVRNDIFKLADLEQYLTYSKYFMTSTAIKILRGMIKEQKNYRANSDAKKGMKTNFRESLDRETSASQAIAKNLLEQLISENEHQENFIVEDTTDNSYSKERERSDSTHPSYISPFYTVLNDFMVQCFYPQFNFETTGSSGGKGCIIVCAESANLKSFRVTDQSNPSSQDNQNLHLVKKRHEIVIENSQFFSTSKESAFNEFNHCGLIQNEDHVIWPIWVPMENLFDNQLSTFEFKRFVEKATIFVQVDRCSPIYLKKATIQQSKPVGLSENESDLEHVDSVYVKFPKVEIAADSVQYCYLNDVISNVLIYNDPTRKRRNEKVNSMLFAIFKEDLSKVVDIVRRLQFKIRSLEMAQRNILDSHEIELHNQFHYYDLEKKISEAHDDLVLIMEALKRVVFDRQVQGSVKMHSRTVIDADELAWDLVQDNGRDLCEFSITGIHYNMFAYDDRSKVNRIEINKLSLINKLENPYYVDLIAPYLTDGRQVNFDMHKMVRVYWRELAPVAGIPIMDHFEINIFPLLFQMTYVVGKGLVEYLYPKKSSPVAPATSSVKRAVQLGRPRAKTNAKEVLSFSSMSAISRSRSHSMSKMNDPKVGDGSLSSENSTSVSGHEKEVSVEDPLSKRSRAYSRSILPNIAQKLIIPSGSNLPEAFKLVNEQEDVKMMRDRASSNKTFVYIKVPGSTHCLSYHGKKDNNIEDLDKFVLKVPTLEYHNKTWSWLEFLIAVRRDIVLAIVSQTGSLVREKFFTKQKKGLNDQ